MKQRGRYIDIDNINNNFQGRSTTETKHTPACATQNISNVLDSVAESEIEVVFINGQYTIPVHTTLINTKH